MDSALAKLMHSRSGNFHVAWRMVAQDLLTAAQILREQRESCDLSSLAVGDPVPAKAGVGRVECMLRGMAAECLLKAVWVKRRNLLAADGRYRPIPGAHSHDLPQIASKIGLQLSDSEADVLRRLSHFIEYAGRYPIPKDAEKLRPTPALGGGLAVATYWTTPSDYLTFDALIDRLGGLLDQK